MTYNSIVSILVQYILYASIPSLTRYTLNKNMNTQGSLNGKLVIGVNVNETSKRAIPKSKTANM